jgi:hypothetical protein
LSWETKLQRDALFSQPVATTVWVIVDENDLLAGKGRYSIR